jgi:DNA repair protein RecO (recombination protein O)
LPVVHAEAFVLRVHPLGEADKIVTFLTREEGKLRGVARSARKSRRRFGSSLELWSRVSLSLFEKEGMDLARIDGCDLLESAYRLQEDLETAYLLAYMAEVTDLFSRERQPEPHFFRLVDSLLQALRGGLPGVLAARYFETWTLKLHGLLPDLGRCGACDASLESGGATFQSASGQIFCRRCLPHPTPADFPVEAAGLEVLRSVLRHHPADLTDRLFPRPLLVGLGRVTGAALSSFAEAPFRTSRFLAVAERAS